MLCSEDFLFSLVAATINYIAFSLFLLANIAKLAYLLDNENFIIYEVFLLIINTTELRHRVKPVQTQNP